MSQINIRNLCNENEDGAPTIVGVSTFSATSYMCPPKGTTAQRPSNPVSGSLRFNTDTASLEYYRGDTLNWTQIEMTSPDLGGGARGIYAMSYQPSTSDRIEYITIPTLGNATDFGNLTVARKFGGAAASRTRGCWAGGQPSQVTIDYVTISSTGDAIDFGDRTQAATEIDGLSTEIRGVFCGGYVTPANRDTMDYITIASTGNAVDFGNLSAGRGSQGQCGGASSTRGLWAGGQWTSPIAVNTIEYITVASTGNSADFGDLFTGQSTNAYGGATTSTKMYCMGTATADTGVITIATLGNATDFGGDMDMGGSYNAAAGSPTRGVCAGAAPGVNTIKYIDYATASDGIDFGDLTGVASGMKGLSNAHGGL